MRKGCTGLLELAILPQFLAIEPHFVRKGCAGQLELAILPQFLTIHLISWKSQFYPSFWRSNLISCERVAPDNLNSQFYLSFWRSNLISCERVAFRAVSLALPLPPAFKREIEKKERARGQEGKRARGQKGKRARGQEGKMVRGEDVRMRRCEDEKM